MRQIIRRSVYLVLGTLFPALVSAYPYPPEAFYETVKVIYDGPAAFVYVGAGMGNVGKDLIVYKNSGYLASLNHDSPESIDAVVTVKCVGELDTLITKTTTVPLTREWHGAGYMSIPLSFMNHEPWGCFYNDGRMNVQVAFSDGHGHWDSRFGANFSYDRAELRNPGYVEGRSVFFNTQRGPSSDRDEGGSGINAPAWEFILSEISK